MFTIEDIVSSAFSDASFGLEAMELVEMVQVVTLQVDSLLAQYHAESHDDPAIPAQLATMLQRSVGDIGTSLSSLQDRSHDVFHQLLMGEPKVSSTYVRSLNELAQTLTGMIGINKLTILARIRLMIGSVGTGTHSVGFLESLGFSEPVADSIFNRRHCKDVFICLFLVTMYSFVMKIPRPTGVQNLRGIRVAVALNEEDALDQPVVIDQRPANRTSARVAAASNTEIIRDPPVLIDQSFASRTNAPGPGDLDAVLRSLVASITGLTSQVGRLQHDLDTLKGQATLPVRDRQGPAAPFAALTDENDTAVTSNQARQAAIDDDALLSATLRAMEAGMNNDRLAPVAPGNLLRDGQGIADVRSEMLADYALGRDDLTLSDILCALTSSDGVRLIGVSQVIHEIHREYSKNANPANKRILTNPINPDKLSRISSLPLSKKSRNMYPVTADHLKQFLMQELLLCQTLDDFEYRVLPGLSVSQTNSKYLSQYIKLIMKLLENVLHGSTNSDIQSNSHHITLFSLILRFHINRYNRACVHQDLSILVQDFHSHWSLEYATQMGNGTDGLPLVPLSDALEMLSYVCDKCGRFAVARQFCTTVECRTKSAAAKVTKASVTHPGFFAAIKKYRVGKPTTTDAEFRLTAEFKALVPKADKVATEAPLHSSDTSASFSHRQHEIAQPVPLTFSY